MHAYIYKYECTHTHVYIYLHFIFFSNQVVLDLSYYIQNQKPIFILKLRCYICIFI